MKVYRLSKSEFSSDLTGKGAERSGGRWNSKGVAMIYTSTSRALCTAEVAVHLPLGILPDDYCLVTIEIPDDSIGDTEAGELPDDWKVFPHPHSTQVIGDRFIKQLRTLTLRVPSVVVQGEYNLLINPLHPEIEKVRILNTEPFVFDKRLFTGEP